MSSSHDFGIPEHCGNDVRLKINKMFPLTALIWQNQTQDSHQSVAGQMVVQQAQPSGPDANESQIVSGHVTPQTTITTANQIDCSDDQMNGQEPF